MKAANRRLERRAEVCARLEETGRTLIHLCEAQIATFAGNAIELQGSDSRLLALSQTAFDALEPSQKRAIEQSARLVPLTIPTIEMGADPYGTRLPAFTWPGVDDPPANAVR